MSLRNWKLTLLWIFGAGSILIGTIIASSLEQDVGVTDIGYTIAILLAFMLYLLGGLLWISVAIAAKKISEK